MARRDKNVIAGTARGFRDILPQEALARERITNEVRECFSAHGYLPVETPLLEDRAALERGGHAGPFETLLRTAVARSERRRRLPAPPAPATPASPVGTSSTYDLVR